MKNHSSFFKIRDLNQNFTIKLILFICIVLFISKETNKDFIYNTYKFEKLLTPEKPKSNQNRSNSTWKTGIRTNIKSEIFKKTTNSNVSIVIHKDTLPVKTNKINKTNKNITHKRVRYSRSADIQSFIENIPNLPSIIYLTEALSNDLKIQRMKPYSDEGNLQEITTAQQGNFNVAIQINVKNAGQVQYIQQIGMNNNNPYRNNNTIRKSSIDNSLLINAGFLMLNNVFENSKVGSLSFPVSQYSNQILGIAVENVFGNDNYAYQFQESANQQLGRNEAYMYLKGNKNDVIQGQSGSSNNSKIDIIGNRNLVTNFQYGEFNYAGITISPGVNNVVNVEQTGLSNISLIFQNGINNIVNVVQNQY